MAKNAFWDAVNGYELPNESPAAKRTGKRFFSRSISGSITRKKKKVTSLGLFRAMDWLSRLISYTSTKAYGAAFLSFGLVTLLLHFVKDYTEFRAAATTGDIITFIVCAVVSVPLLLFDRPMCIALQDFPLTDLILFEFFCVKRMHRTEKHGSIPTLLAIAIATALAMLECLIQTELLVLAIAAFAVAYIAIVSPEFALLSSFLLIPYLPHFPYGDIALPVMIAIGLLSLIRKVIYGKRVVHIEQYDFFIGLMMLMVLISGIFIKGYDSFTSSLGMLLISAGYLLCSNLITNRRLADRALCAIVLSSLPASVIAIADLVGGILNGDFPEILNTGLTGGFSDPSELAAYLLVTLVLTTALIKQSHGAQRGAYALIFTVQLVALALTAQRFALIALLLGGLVYLALNLRGFAAFAIALIMLLPYAVFLIPENILSIVFADTVGGLTAGEVVSLWRASFAVLLDNLWVGMGIGATSFREEFASPEFVGVTDVHNTFIELGLEAGVFAVACFVILLLIRLRHTSVYHRYLKNSQVSTLSPIVLVATFVILMFGTVDYILSDAAVAYLFWSVFGIGAASLRVAKREHDDRVLYFDGGASATSSVVDIELR